MKESGREVAEIGWRCWDAESLGTIVYLPGGLAIRFAVIDPKNRLYQNQFRWPQLARLGLNLDDGSYSEVTLRCGRARFRLTAHSQKAQLYYMMEPLEGCEDLISSFEVKMNWQMPGKVLTKEQSIYGVLGEEIIRIWSLSPHSHRVGTSIRADLGRKHFVRAQPASREDLGPEERGVGYYSPQSPKAPYTSEEQAVEKILEQARERAYARLPAVPPELEEATEAIFTVNGWNIIWPSSKQEATPVCSRDWCVLGNYGDHVLFVWDNFFIALASAEVSADLCKLMLRPQLAVIKENGLLPGISCEVGESLDRSMPPVGAWCVWKAYQRTGDISILEMSFEPLLKWHRWFRLHRAKHPLGLLCWGSDPAPLAHPQWQSGTYWGARYEAGLDNIHCWDEAEYDEKTHTLNLADVGLNALIALDSLCLSEMAGVLKLHHYAAELREEGLNHGELIERTMWDEQDGCYYNLFFDGSFNKRISPSNFLPLFLPTCSRERAERVVKIITDESRFWLEFALPNTPKDDPAFRDQYYARGRIWPMINLLVHQALWAAGFVDTARELAEKCAKTYLPEWRESSYLRENYNALTGRGDDTCESDPVYSFGPLLPLITYYQWRDEQALEATMK